ncbi:adipokinetic prohormone type 2 [Anabrus simplex]|uniref:adipokinetic prohormone type 2 n=1 Tax=Anabrus simplex TaxID=316456 RepID=UPI0034DD0A7C
MACCCRLILGALLLVVAELCCQVDGQVTFSRDWNAGKRSGAEQCAVPTKSAVTACQMLVNELRQVAACEVRNFLRFQADDVGNPQDLFIDTHGRR